MRSIAVVLLLRTAILISFAVIRRSEEYHCQKVPDLIGTLCSRNRNTAECPDSASAFRSSWSRSGTAGNSCTSVAKN